MEIEQQAGVLVRGPGTGTSDSIPAALSDGELVIPADDVRRFGAAHLMRMVKQMGSQLPEPGVKDGVQHAAAGGMIAEPYGPQTNDVTRVGNSYSGGNIGGPITVNGQAPGGTMSTVDPLKPAVPAPVAPNPTMPGASSAPAALPSAAPPAPAVAPPPNSMQPGGQMSWTGRPQPAAGINQILGALSQRAQVPKPAAPPPVQASSAGNQQFFSQGALGYAQGGLVDERDLRRPLSAYAAQAESTAMMGRRPPIDMGMAQEVPRTALPTPAGAGGAIVPAAPGTDVIGRRAPVYMGAADVVQPSRLAGGSAPLSQAALPAAESAVARMPLSRAALGGAGAALGAGLEGKQVYDVATNPNSTGLDVAAQAAQGVGRLGAAGAGAAGGAAAGSALGPVGAAVGGIIGGGVGYFAADKAIAGGRELVGADPRSPAAQIAASAPPSAPAAAPTPPEGGGAVLGFFPQLGRNQFRSNAMDAQLRRGWQSTAPGVFAPAQPAVAPPPAVPQRLDNLTDPRSTQFAGGANTAPLAQPMSEPLVDAFGNGTGALPQDPNLPQGVSRSGNTYSDRSTGTGVGFIGTPGVTSADRVAQMGRDADATRSLSARALELARQGVGGPTPGLSVIDNPGPAAAQAMFDGAALRTAAARGSWSPRKGYQSDDSAIAAAAVPLAQRAQQQALQTKEQGDTVRAQLQEQGLASRAKVQDVRQADANSIARAHLGLEQQKIGIDAAKANIAANKDTIQQVKDTQDIFSILDQAQPLLQQATNSVLGNGVDKAAQLVGVSTKGAEAAAQLKTLQGALVAKMPKMSGPQSDKDVQLYREMAGQIGDPTIPREQRQAAMQTIRSINEKYLPAPADAAGFASLPSGSTFRAPDGSIRRKP